MNAPGEELAAAALAIARVEYPVARRHTATWTRWSAWATKRPRRVARAGVRGQRRHHRAERVSVRRARIEGNRAHYDDPRNSFLNEVLDRRRGIPITLALV